ncbi:hypothetical protein COLO4_06358 [Corchorus olitorius]|uniref:Uncharacterized protein n=1 Tax=Corchorus olitorius TaxID=93759 RepID=A0A1R3KNB0_9ROSI|nr:hypothetical protein COLO4_06358 [Corchorus olitorius]
MAILTLKFSSLLRLRIGAKSGDLQGRDEKQSRSGSGCDQVASSQITEW